MTDINYISGPVVLIKLKGTVGKINKNIVLFGEYHYEKYSRNRCEDFTDKKETMYVSNYLKEMITKSDKTIDFFLEIQDVFRFTPLKI